MHIPDGYLGPRTCVLFYAVMLPVWYKALKTAEKTLEARHLPLVAFSSAFVFVIMMFNFPVPGGTTGHIAGGALVSIVVGPWVGVLAVSIALFLQAAIFADGGITTYGVNCFNMAFLMSFSGYYVFRILDRGQTNSRCNSQGNSRARRVALFVAGYVAVNIAALSTALILGIQPILEHDPGGRALYAPYPLQVTLPAMLIPHILFFGPLEGLSTAFVASYLFKTKGEDLSREKTFVSPMWVFLLVLITLTPLGLIASGKPWGEWAGREFSGFIGYVPAGMQRLGGLWAGLLPDYGMEGVPRSMGYILSAFSGSAAMVFVIYLVGRLWRR